MAATNSISSMRWVVGNWKMNLSPEASVALTRHLCALTIPNGVNAWIAPSTESLMAVHAVTHGSRIGVGAQNACGDKPGAFTGELSVPALKEIGCQFAIVGHSERRHIFGETDALCAKRALGILAQGLKVIFCIGETIEQRQNAATKEVLKRQLDELLKKLELSYATNLILAYEPVWAIGTGKVAQEPEIADAHSFIRSLSSAYDLPILYGGSVTPDNFGSILRIQNVAGGLIGGASLDAEKFSKLLDAAAQA